MANIKIPTEWDGEPIKGSIDEVLKNQKVQPEVKPKPKKKSIPLQSNGNEYLILESPTKSYHDLLVPTQRSYFDKDWNEMHDLLRKNDEYMLTIRQFNDFLNLLKSGKAFYENGTQASQQNLDNLFDEITEVKNPWRAEYLDAKFSKSGLINKQWKITYHKIKDDGTLEEVTEPLEDCLMNDKEPGIDMNHWLKNATLQGLPTKNTKDGKLYFYHPRDGAVARFFANSDWAGLDCSRNPGDSGSSLGVRAAREK